MVQEVYDVTGSPETLQTPETICIFNVRLSFGDDIAVNVPDAQLSAMADTLLHPRSMYSSLKTPLKHELFQAGTTKMHVTRLDRRSHGRQLTKGLLSSLTVGPSS